MLRKWGKDSLRLQVPGGDPKTQRLAPQQHKKRSPSPQGAFPQPSSSPPEEAQTRQLEIKAAVLQKQIDQVNGILESIHQQLEELEGKRDTWLGEQLAKDETHTEWELAQIKESMEGLQHKLVHQCDHLSALTKELVDIERQLQPDCVPETLCSSPADSGLVERAAVRAQTKSQAATSIQRFPRVLEEPH